MISSIPYGKTPPYIGKMMIMVGFYYVVTPATSMLQELFKILFNRPKIIFREPIF